MMELVWRVDMRAMGRCKRRRKAGRGLVPELVTRSIEDNSIRRTCIAQKWQKTG